MYLSSMHRIEDASIEVDRTEKASSLGDYVLRFGILTTIYLTETEARTLHNALFNAIHPFPSHNSTNVKVLP